MEVHHSQSLAHVNIEECERSDREEYRNSHSESESREDCAHDSGIFKMDCMFWSTVQVNVLLDRGGFSLSLFTATTAALI